MFLSVIYQYHTTCLPCKNDGMWSTSTLKPLGEWSGGSINSVWVIRAFLWFINSCSYLQPFLPVIGGSPDANMWYTRLPQASFSPEMTRKTSGRSIEGSLMLRTSIERSSKDQSILKSIKKMYLKNKSKDWSKSSKGRPERSSYSLRQSRSHPGTSLLAKDV